MSEKIKIYLADDHQVLLDGIQFLLNTITDFEVVGFSLNGKNLYEEVIATNAAVLILDLNMPEKDGIEVVKEFAQKGIPCKIIILSSYDDLKLIMASIPPTVTHLSLADNSFHSKTCEKLIDFFK